MKILFFFISARILISGMERINQIVCSSPEQKEKFVTILLMSPSPFKCVCVCGGGGGAHNYSRAMNNT